MITDDEYPKANRDRDHSKVDAQTRKQHIPFFDEPACTCTGEMLQRSVTRLAAALVPEEPLDLASHKINRHLSMLAAIALKKI